MSRNRALAVVMASLRARAHGRGGQPLGHDEPPLADQLWPEVVATASAHFVLAALAPALGLTPLGQRVPTDVSEFLGGITRANAARNRGLLAALEAIGSKLGGIGIVPTILKGAAFLAEDRSGAADWRFMQDIDLLVPAERLEASVAALAGIGYQAESPDYDPATEAHYPPLRSPCGRFSIELHTRLFGHGEFGLAASAVAGEARSLRVGSVDMLVPSPRHRLGHILVHAQIHTRFHSAERLVLKDLLDLSMLAGGHDAVVQAATVDELFAGDRRVRQATRALFDTWVVWASGPDGDKADPGPWGRRALARLGWPGWRQLANMPADLARLELDRLRTEPGHLARRVETIANPQRLAGAAAAWSAKQRQRMWG